MTVVLASMLSCLLEGALRCLFRDIRLGYFLELVEELTRLVRFFRDGLTEFLCALLIFLLLVDLILDALHEESVTVLGNTLSTILHLLFRLFDLEVRLDLTLSVSALLALLLLRHLFLVHLEQWTRLLLTLGTCARHIHGHGLLELDRWHVLCTNGCLLGDFLRREMNVRQLVKAAHNVSEDLFDLGLERTILSGRQEGIRVHAVHLLRKLVRVDVSEALA